MRMTPFACIITAISQQSEPGKVSRIARRSRHISIYGTLVELSMGMAVLSDPAEILESVIVGIYWGSSSTSKFNTKSF